MSDLHNVLINMNKHINLLGGEVKNLHRALSDAKELGDPKLISKIQKQLSWTETAYSKARIKYRTIKAAVEAQKSGVAVDIKDTSSLSSVAISALIASAIAASVLLYKRFLSKAAKACKDKKGSDKTNCMRKFKITGYQQAIKSLKQSLLKCSNTKDPSLCKSKIENKIKNYEFKIKKETNKLSESKIMETVIESYLKFLYDPKYQVSKTIRGSNIPIEHDEKINWIRQCMMLECDRKKINCLRKLRDQVAMNPFYQYRIDRFVDAITNTYEPTDEPGTIPGNEFKEPKYTG